MCIYHAMIRHICKHVLQAEGQTVLHIASLNGDENMTRTLYLARANPSVTDNEGNNKDAILWGHGSRDSGNDFFVPQFLDSFVTFQDTRKRNKNVSFRFLGYPQITDHRFILGTQKRNEKKRDFRFYYYF